MSDTEDWFKGKSRRHTNKHARQQRKSGSAKRTIKNLAHKLGIPYKSRRRANDR